MRHGDVNYERWNPEAKALAVSCVLWLTLHGLLMDFNRMFVWSWCAHWLINAVWGLSYMWRVGTQRHRRWVLYQKLWSNHCRICHAKPGERWNGRRCESETMWFDSAAASGKIQRDSGMPWARAVAAEVITSAAAWSTFHCELCSFV